MSLQMMTFHESFGDLAVSTLRRIRRFNISPSDYDGILAAFGWSWDVPESIDWTQVNEFIDNASLPTGIYRPSRYL